MKEFVSELLYHCSASNTKSRGLYIFITAALALLILGSLASLVLLVLNLILYKAFSILFAVLFIVALAITVGVIIWLKKS